MLDIEFKVQRHFHLLESRWPATVVNLCNLYENRRPSFKLEITGNDWSILKSFFKVHTHSQLLVHECDHFNDSCVVNRSASKPCVFSSFSPRLLKSIREVLPLPVLFLKLTLQCLQDRLRRQHPSTKNGCHAGHVRKLQWCSWTVNLHLKNRTWLNEKAWASHTSSSFTCFSGLRWECWPECVWNLSVFANVCYVHAHLAD